MQEKIHSSHIRKKYQLYVSRFGVVVKTKLNICGYTLEERTK